MLSEVSISALTHGLSLHPQPHTLTLRFPYHEQDYCNMASNHILSRSSTDLREVEQDIFNMSFPSGQTDYLRLLTG